MEILGGPLFAVAGAGESHGPAVTTIVFGCPPGLFVRAADIQHYLDRRRPGSNRHGTPRREDDTVVLLAGLYQDDRDQAVRCSHENPEVVRLYRDFLGQPNGTKAHELLHTRYTARPLYKR